MIGVMPLVELQYVRVLHGRRLDPMGSISSGARASPTARARRPGIGPASQVPPPCARRSLHQELRCGSGLKQLEEFQYLSGSSWTHAQPAPVRAPAHLPVRSRALAAASPAPRARPRVRAQVRKMRFISDHSIPSAR